jgi:hypothetical protein
MPKPVAITYGVCRSQLMFHEVPASPEVTFKHDSGKVGKISVLGGTMTAMEVIHELNWIISANHQWDLQSDDNGAFKAVFPSKADLARMIKIVKVPVPETNMFLLFEEWSAAELDLFTLTSVWVRVQGVCYKERCDYLALFGIGSLIGKTKEVDMVFTRANTSVRMLVEVTRAEHIPTTTVDHLYDGKGYGLIFERETEIGKVQMDITMHDDNADEDAPSEEGSGKRPMDSAAGSEGKDMQAKTPPAAPADASGKQVPAKQVGGSLPAVRVGFFDCPSPPVLAVKAFSQSKLARVRPRKLWSERSDIDEDDLPSPLPPVGVLAEAGGASLESGVSSASAQQFLDLAPSGGSPASDQRLVSDQPAADSAAPPTAESDQVAADQYVAPGVPIADPMQFGGSGYTSTGILVPNLYAQDAHNSSFFRPINVFKNDDSVSSSDVPGTNDVNAMASSNIVSQQHDVAAGTNSANDVGSLPTILNFDTNVNSSQTTHEIGVPNHHIPCTDCPEKTGTGVFLGGRYSVQDVVAFGGISPPSRRARSSPRILKQKNADATQLKRAQNLAKAKDVAFSSGTSNYSRFSLASIPDNVVAERAKSMGVLLGSSFPQVLNTIHNIKEMDNTRTLITITKNLEQEYPDESTSLDILNHATSLSTDLDDNSQLAQVEQTPCRVDVGLKTYKRRPKVVPNVLRRSIRIGKQIKKT